MNELFRKINEKSYLGFTFFDIIHLVASAAVLAIMLIERPAHWQLYCAECFTAMIFSILLIAFIVRFAKKTQTDLDKKVDLNFAFLVASSSLFVPETFFIATFIDVPLEERAAEIAFFIASLAIIILSFAFFLVALFHVESKKWGRSLFLGMVFFVLSSPLMVCYCIFEGGSPLIVALRVLVSLAPILPFAFVFAGKVKEKTTQNISNENKD